MLSNFIGQKNVTERLSLILKSAQKQGKSAISHCLFSGPSGTGKTHIAKVIAKHLNSEPVVLNGANLSGTQELQECLVGKKCGVLFIDEIHALSGRQQDFLLTCMSDLSINFGALEVKIEPFTAIGATTDEGLLNKAFLNRFTYKFRFSLYNNKELAQIAKGYLAANYTIEAADILCEHIAATSRGIPRECKQRCDWLFDYCAGSGEPMSLASFHKSIRLADLDEKGYTKDDRRYLEALRSGPKSLQSLADALSVSSHTIQTVIEPFLIKEGKITRSSSGRKLLEV